jgi:ankyrin repeat protein
MQELLLGVSVVEHKDMFQSLMYKACKSDWEPAVSYLLERGADVNITDDQNQTPLMRAVSGRSGKVVGCLVQHMLYEGKCENDDTMISALRCLIRSATSDMRDGGCRNYHLDEIVQGYKKAGIDLNFHTPNSHTLLMDMDTHSMYIFGCLLLQNCAELNVVARDGCSVLWTQCNGDQSDKLNVSVLEDLLAQNIDMGISKHQHRGMTPLQVALERHEHALCNLLLDADCSLHGMSEYLSSTQEHKLKEDMQKVQTRILERCDEPYSLKVQSRLAVLRGIGQGDLSKNLHRMHRCRVLPTALVNYLGKAIQFNVNNV